MARTRIKFDVLLPALSSTFNLTSLVATAAEKSNFASVWCIDHLICEPEFYRLLGIDPATSELLETWTTLTAVAAQTKRVMLGTAVTPVPRYNPTMLAKIVATLDVVSNGRFILGVGAGHYKPDFQANGLPWKGFTERIHMMREGIEVIKKLWTQQVTTHFGKYFKVVDVSHQPKPIQKPHPPIWLGGNSLEIMKATAELGNGWIPRVLTPQEYQDKLSKIEEMAEEAGRNPREIEPAYFMDTNVSLDAKSAVETSKPCVEAGRGRPFKEAEKRGVFGSPDIAVNQIEKFIEAGVKHFILVMIPQRNILNCIKLYDERVIPKFK